MLDARVQRLALGVVGAGHNLRARLWLKLHAAAMASQSSKSSPTGNPEYAVRRETISRYFEPPLPRSTFHDFVNKGIIIPMKGLRGFYLLNASLSRLGLREVPKLPAAPAKRSLEDIVRLAFSLIDPLLFPPPTWLLTAEELDLKDVEHARLLADQHREAVNAFNVAELKIAYLGGVLDAQVMIAEDMKSWAE
jgi:hypothetical protein